MFQAFNLFPHMTVLDNVTLAPRKVLQTPRAEAEADATALLERFGLADKRTEYPDRLSGGQQQRVAIVRALAMRAGPAAPRRGHERARPGARGRGPDVIRELAAGGMTMLIATHEMGFARDIANRVCFLDDGLILEQGPPELIFRDAARAADPAVPRADHRGRPALARAGGGQAGAGPRAASTKTANSRSNAGGVDSVRSGWHWTPRTNRPSAASRPSTRSPAGLLAQALGDEARREVAGPDRLVVVRVDRRGRRPGRWSGTGSGRAACRARRAADGSRPARAPSSARCGRRRAGGASRRRTR